MPDLFMPENFTRYFFFLFFLFLGQANNSFAQLSTVGREFWLGFMENNRVQNFNNPANSALDFGIVLITAAEPAIGVIQYGGRQVNFNLQQGEQFFYKITDQDMLHRSTGIVESKGVYVQSSGNVSVYAFNERARSADGTVVLPIPSLGKDYFVVSHFETMTAPTGLPYFPNVNDESLFLIVGVEDNTRIEVVPSAFTLNGNAANTPFYINLNAGQSYQVKAKADLTGSRVRVVGDNIDDCKNIAVFGGNKWTSVGNCGGANDHLFQQLYPTKTWGTDYLHISLAGRTSGELVKVMASENNTQVMVDGQLVGSIDAGKFLTFDFESDVVKRIQSDKPSSVTVFSKSQECNKPGSPLFQDGDPFMISYSPTQQLLRSVTFNAIQLPVVTAHYVNIIVKTTSTGTTRLDGQNIGNRFTPFPQQAEFSYARIPINQGVHSLSNPDGFIAYVYGFGDVESYGYAAGASLDNLNFEVEPLYEFDIEGDKVACLNQNAKWQIFPENEIFTYFLWDFGDGTGLKEGKEVEHIFTQKGEYEVKVIASVSQTSCDLQEEVVFKVEVTDVGGEIIGPTSVCPDVEEITYNFKSSDTFQKVDWRQVGGEVIAKDDKQGSITIRWGEANPNAAIYAIPYTTEGCPLEEIELRVIINPVIQSIIPQGQKQVCFEPEGEYEYTVSNAMNFRAYEWFVENGTFIGDSEGSKVKIKWDSPGVTGRVWYKEYSLIDESCEGESPRLEVTVNQAFIMQSPEKTDVSCYGGNDGQIFLNIEGGVLPYKFEWSHDASLNAPRAIGLKAGTYNVKVIDGFGCEILAEEVEIRQPQTLQISSIETFGTTCFGKADGRAVLSIQGGTAPYFINYQDAIFNENLIFLENLEGKQYSLKLKDSKGCFLNLEFGIDSPLPAQLEITQTRSSCPGQSNGELMVIPSLGFTPLHYRWDYDGGQGQLLSGLPKGIYQVIATDANGCEAIGTSEVRETPPVVRMPTGFKLGEDLFMGISNCDLRFNLSIFSRWGQLVYNGIEGWDGKIDGENAPMGTYSYLFQYNFLLDGEVITMEKRGVFTIIQ
ncbi:PKD domain-containing protein [Cecembia rubra]|nr:PKD domain-containing protein [Cecembia rubra]